MTHPPIAGKNFRLRKHYKMKPQMNTDEHRAAQPQPKKISPRRREEILCDSSRLRVFVVNRCAKILSSYIWAARSLSWGSETGEGKQRRGELHLPGLRENVRGSGRDARQVPGLEAQALPEL